MPTCNAKYSISTHTGRELLRELPSDEATGPLTQPAAVRAESGSLEELLPAAEHDDGDEDQDGERG